MIKQGPILHPADISAAVLYVLGTPPHVQVNDDVNKNIKQILKMYFFFSKQIHELTIKPVGEKF